jgi:DNA-binding transcriptional ArsR family regulator
MRGRAGGGSRRRSRRRAPLPRGLARVRALAHPLRLRLLELFAERPRTTMQAAQALGEAPTRLYHHVAALERAGLVRLRETRPNRGTTEKYFETVSKSMRAGDGLGRPGSTVRMPSWCVRWRRRRNPRR